MLEICLIAQSTKLIKWRFKWLWIHRIFPQQQQTVSIQEAHLEIQANAIIETSRELNCLYVTFYISEILFFMLASSQKFSPLLIIVRIITIISMLSEKPQNCSFLVRISILPTFRNFPTTFLASQSAWWIDNWLNC